MKTPIIPQSHFAFDKAALALIVAARLAHDKQRYADMAAAAGVSKTTIFRARHKNPISIGNFLALCLYLGEDPFTFLIEEASGMRVAVGAPGVLRDKRCSTGNVR